MVAWPAELPQRPQTDGFTETFPDNVIRTQMDAGPGKTRRRSTVDTSKLSVTYYLSGALVETLRDFFLDDVAGGATQFDYPNPRTGATIVVRFMGPPKVSNMGGDEYRVTFDLERLQ